MDTSKEQKPKSPWLLRAISWPLALGSFIAYCVHKGSAVVPPTSVLDGTFLWMSVGFLLLPFVRSVKIGKLLELEREVEKARETVREVRDDVRQVTSMVVAGLSATSTARATVVVQGAVEPSKALPPAHAAAPAVAPVATQPVEAAKAAPQLPPKAAEAARSAAELKLLNTLWHFQVERYPDLNLRWTFRVDGPAAEAAVFSIAAASLLRDGLITQSADGQVLLSDEGLRYCKANARHFPADTWFFPEPLNRAKEDDLRAKIEGLK